VQQSIQKVQQALNNNSNSPYPAKADEEKTLWDAQETLRDTNDHYMKPSGDDARDTLMLQLD